MTACINDRYPSISEIVPDPIEVNNDEKEAKEVPIYPTFANPSFNLVTRGTGVFEDWESDQAHWMSAPFLLGRPCGGRLYEVCHATVPAPRRHAETRGCTG